MPTIRPRYQVTETPDLARLLDRAEQRWPGEPRSKLLLRLIAVGGDTIANETSTAECARHAAVAATGSRYAAAFGPDYLRELRADWPG